jgi:hypothetical protein
MNKCPKCGESGFFRNTKKLRENTGAKIVSNFCIECRHTFNKSVKLGIKGTK